MKQETIHLNAEEMQILDEAIVNGYIIDTKASMKPVKAYWNWCSRNNRPVISIRPARKYSRVVVDFITVRNTGGFSQESVQKIVELLRHYDLRPGPFPFESLGGIYTYFDVKKEVAPEIAVEMWKLAKTEMNST